MEGVCLFIPIHDNHVENVAALVTRFPARIYQYEWHMCPSESQSFFESLGVPVKSWSLESVLTDIVEETRGVVFVMTANLTHAVGKTQHKLFKLLQDKFPTKVVDIFHVGHCMYGCQSCAIKSHNVPLFFSRYHLGTLGFTVSDLMARHRLHPGIKMGGDKPIVVIAPSVFTLSLLNDDKVVDELCLLIKEGDAQFVVKPHPLLYHTNSLYPSFHRLEKESMSIQKLVRECTGMSHMMSTDGCTSERVAPVRSVDLYNLGWSSLPCLEMADIVITDVDSSLSFEALYMEGLSILSYNPPQHMVPDAELAGHYNIFQKKEQLRGLLMSVVGMLHHESNSMASGANDLTANGCVDDKGSCTTTHPLPNSLHGMLGYEPEIVRVSTSSRNFFRRLYGDVDGHEVVRLAQQRQWDRVSVAKSDDKFSIPQILESLIQSIRGSRRSLFPSEELILGCHSRSVPELYAAWRAHSQPQARKNPKAKKDREEPPT